MIDRLTALERATGIVIGLDPDAPLPPKSRTRETPLDAFRGAVRTALERPPAFVLFSGGRDSSAVLAVAADEARRSGLPAPYAVTCRFAGAADTDERAWQELVVSHVGVADWITIEIHDELDLVGPLGADALARHGVVFPVAPHAAIPAYATAAGGSLLTGNAGDEFLSRGWRIHDVLGRRRRPVARDALRVAVAFAPRAVRRRRYRQPPPAFIDWLTPTGQTLLEEQWARTLGAERAHFGRGTLHMWRSRALRLALEAFACVARDYDVRLVHPFADGRFVRAFADAGGLAGFGGRTAAMRALFSGVLPDAVLSRTTKAAFDAPFWGPATQAFARSTDGAGLDPDLVDVDALLAHWRAPGPPPAPTNHLLKISWLAVNARADLAELREQASGALAELVPGFGAPQHASR
jgi:asparagine synthase (glutamine-hydrolysing)